MGKSPSCESQCIRSYLHFLHAHLHSFSTASTERRICGVVVISHRVDIMMHHGGLPYRFGNQLPAERRTAGAVQITEIWQRISFAPSGDFSSHDVAGLDIYTFYDHLMSGAPNLQRLSVDVYINPPLVPACPESRELQRSPHAGHTRAVDLRAASSLTEMGSRKIHPLRQLAPP